MKPKEAPSRRETMPLSAVDLLKDDHRKVKEIFEEFESSEDSSTKRRLVGKALIELSIHAKLEEELFYPVVRREIKENDLLDEAEEEHHVAKVLIGELAGMKPSEPRFNAKFLVLAESVRHHIEEEEGEMFPKIEESDCDLESLGQEMSERKMTLLDETDLASIRREGAGVREGEVSRRPGGVRSRRGSRGSRSGRQPARSKSRSRA